MGSSWCDPLSTSPQRGARPEKGHEMNEKKTRLQEIKRSMGLMGGRPERINTIPTDTPSSRKASNDERAEHDE